MLYVILTKYEEGLIVTDQTFPWMSHKGIPMHGHNLGSAVIAECRLCITEMTDGRTDDRRPRPPAENPHGRCIQPRDHP